jgi:hypothetical protein
MVSGKHVNIVCYADDVILISNLGDNLKRQFK